MASNGQKRIAPLRGRSTKARGGPSPSGLVQGCYSLTVAAGQRPGPSPGDIEASLGLSLCLHTARGESWDPPRGSPITGGPPPSQVPGLFSVCLSFCVCLWISVPLRLGDRCWGFSLRGWVKPPSSDCGREGNPGGQLYLITSADCVSQYGHTQVPGSQPPGSRSEGQTSTSNRDISRVTGPPQKP